MSTVTSKRSSRKSADDLVFEDETPLAEPPKNPVAAAPSRTRRAREYEGKVSEVLNLAMRPLASNEATAADAAALIVHGPTIASKAGDLADADERVRRAVDFITSGTENPYISFALASLPLAAQILRNHETTDLSRHAEIKIPFTKRTMKLPFKFKLRNPFVRSLTVEPQSLAAQIFGQPDIREALRSQNVDLTWLEGNKAG